MAKFSTAPSSQSMHSIRAQESLFDLMQPSVHSIHLDRQIHRIALDLDDPEQALSQIAMAIAKQFQVDRALLVTDLESVQSDRNIYGNIDPIQESTIVLSQWCVERLVASDGLLNITDLGEAGGEFNRERQSDTPPALAVLGIATHALRQSNGAILLMRSQPYTWTNAQLHLLNHITEPVAIAINQLHQARDRDRQRQKLDMMTQQQAAIAQITNTIHQARELDPILDRAVETIAQTLSADRALAIRLKYTKPQWQDDPTSIFQHPSSVKATLACQWSATSGASQSDANFWASNCAWFATMLSDPSQTLAIANLADSSLPAPSADVTAIFQPDAFPAWLSIPLTGATGTVLGVIIVQHARPRQWLAEEVQWMQTIGTLLSTALIQTQTLQQVHNLVEKRTAQLQSSMDVQAKLYEQTRRQLDQVRQLNQEKDNLIAHLHDKVKTPLTVMRMAICNLRQPDLSADRYERYFNILAQTCDAEIDLINDLLTFQKLKSKQTEVNVEKINVNHLISTICSDLDEEWTKKNLTLELDLPRRPLQAQTDRASLERIVRELLDNACKYADTGTTVVLQARSQKSERGNLAVISVTDIGYGISEGDRDRIFEPFERGESITKQIADGSGLGLALVKSWTQLLHGTLDLSSQPIQGSESSKVCFTCRFPQMLDPLHA